MDDIRDKFLRDLLIERRSNLKSAISKFTETDRLVRLLDEVDSALKRITEGRYGLCTACHEPIEEERLINDPLIQTCLDHLTSEEQRSLEEDLDLAARIQYKLLPKRELSINGWEVAYQYEPAGVVSGDYLDLVVPQGEDGASFFLLGDVSGKGVAASMLMAHLNAIFRSLISVGTSVDQLAKQANRIFCESTLSTHYATLVLAKADDSGRIEICNAGHPSPLLVQKGGVKALEATGLPLGMFCDGGYTMREIQLSRGDSLLFYTDGLTETQNSENTEYGEERLIKIASDFHGLSPQEMIGTCLDDLRSFQSSVPKVDDLTIMVIRRTG